HEHADSQFARYKPRTDSGTNNQLAREQGYSTGAEAELLTMKGTYRLYKAYKSHRICLMDEKNFVKTICSAALPIILLASGAMSQRARKPAMSGEALAQAGRCREAIPSLKKELPLITNADLKRSAGLAGVRCAMEIGSLDDAVDFIRALTRDFP